MRAAADRDEALVSEDLLLGLGVGFRVWGSRFRVQGFGFRLIELGRSDGNAHVSKVHPQICLSKAGKSEETEAMASLHKVIHEVSGTVLDQPRSRGDSFELKRFQGLKASCRWISSPEWFPRRRPPHAGSEVEETKDTSAESPSGECSSTTTSEADPAGLPLQHISRARPGSSTSAAWDRPRLRFSTKRVSDGLAVAACGNANRRFATAASGRGRGGQPNRRSR